MYMLNDSAINHARTDLSALIALLCFSILGPLPQWATEFCMRTQNNLALLLCHSFLALWLMGIAKNAVLSQIFCKFPQKNLDNKTMGHSLRNDAS